MVKDKAPETDAEYRDRLVMEAGEAVIDGVLVKAADVAPASDE